MRRRGKIDGNQREVVAALRAIGATVQSLADIGAGCPDLLVGFRGVTWVMEVKDGRKPPSARRLTPAEARWLYSWRGGPACVVECAEDAVAAVRCRP